MLHEYFLAILVFFLAEQVHDFVTGLEIMFVSCFIFVLAFTCFGKFDMLERRVEMYIEDIFIVWLHV
mgnify:FL=1|jgi:hypothetical protein